MQTSDRDFEKGENSVRQARSILFGIQSKRRQTIDGYFDSVEREIEEAPDCGEESGGAEAVHRLIGRFTEDRIADAVALGARLCHASEESKE